MLFRSQKGGTVPGGDPGLLLKVGASMSKLMRNMKMATMPGTHFCWSPEMEEELVNIRNAVSNLLPLTPFNTNHKTFIYVDASYLGFGLGCSWRPLGPQKNL